MAWNEPGGGGDKKDPWGQKNDGPPDLDEALKSLQRKLGGLLGGGGKRGSGGSSSGGSPSAGPVIALAGAAAFGLWLYNCFYIVEPAEQGVTTRFGAYHETRLPGLHFLIWPIDSVIKVNVDQNRQLNLQNQTVLTQDENIVVVDLTVQYTIKDPENYLYRVADPGTTLQNVAESALREIIGKNNMDYIILQGRDDVAARTLESTQGILDQYETGILITALNLTKAQPPEAVQPAFDDANKAREDKERFINEAEAYSNSVVPRARGDARMITEEAKAYRSRVVSAAEGESARFEQILTQYKKAPEVMADRLYIDAMQSVLSQSSKVLLSGAEGSNNMMYLPLDRLLQHSGVDAGPMSRADNKGRYASIDSVEGKETYTPSPDSRQIPRSGLRSRDRGRDE